MNGVVPTPLCKVVNGTRPTGTLDTGVRELSVTLSTVFPRKEAGAGRLQIDILGGNAEC